MGTGGTGGSSTGEAEEDQGERVTLDLAVDAWRLLKSQRVSDRKSVAKLHNQCETMESRVEDMIGKRGEAMEETRKRKDEAVASFRKTVGERVDETETQPLFSGVSSSLRDVAEEVTATKTEWESLKSMLGSTVSESTEFLDELKSEVDSLRGVDETLGSESANVLSNVGASLHSVGSTYEGTDVPSVDVEGELLEDGKRRALRRLEDAFSRHEGAVRDSVAKLRGVLTEIRDSCASMNRDYAEHEASSLTTLQMIGDAVRSFAPGVLRRSGDETFETFISSAVDIESAAVGAHEVPMPMAIEAELSSLRPLVAEQAVALRKKSHAAMVEASDVAIDKREDLELREKQRDQARETYEHASEMAGAAKEELRVALASGYASHDAIGDLVGADLASPTGIFGATGGTFDDELTEDDEQELLGTAIDHQVGIAEIESLRRKADGMQTLMMTETDKVKDAESAVEHARAALDAAEATLTWKKKIWGRSKDAAEEVLRKLGRVVEPTGPIAEDPEALRREREAMRTENEELEKQIEDMQEDGHDVLDDIDVAVNHYDRLAATGASESVFEANEEEAEGGVDRLIGAYGHLRKGRDDAEMDALKSEHGEQSALAALKVALGGSNGE